MCQMKLFVFVVVSVTVLHTSLGAQHKAVHQHPDSLEDYTGSGNTTPTRVIFDHDAGIDDFITLMLLLSQPNQVELLVRLPALVTDLAHAVDSCIWFPIAVYCQNCFDNSQTQRTYNQHVQVVSRVTLHDLRALIAGDR